MFSWNTWFYDIKISYRFHTSTSKSIHGMFSFSLVLF